MLRQCLVEGGNKNVHRYEHNHVKQTKDTGERRLEKTHPDVNEGHVCVVRPREKHFPVYFHYFSNIL